MSRALLVLCSLIAANPAANLPAQLRTAESMLPAAESVLPAAHAPLPLPPRIPRPDAGALEQDTFGADELSRARWTSVLGTLVPIGAGIAVGDATGVVAGTAGVLIGPSLGYFTIGRGGRGLGGIALRAGALAGGIALGAAACGDCNWDSPGLGVAFVSVLGGALVATISALHDIVAVGRAPEGAVVVRAPSPAAPPPSPTPPSATPAHER